MIAGVSSISFGGPSISRQDSQNNNRLVANYCRSYIPPKLAQHFGIDNQEILDKLVHYKLQKASCWQTGYLFQDRNLYSEKLGVSFIVNDNGKPTNTGFGEAVRFAVAEIIKEKLELNEHELFAHWHITQVDKCTVSYDATGILRITMGDGHLLQVDEVDGQLTCKLFKLTNPIQSKYEEIKPMLPAYQSLVDTINTPVDKTEASV